MKIKRLKRLLFHFKLSSLSLYREKISRNLTKNIKSYILGIRKKTFKPEDAIIVFSEARGGSTWIMDILQNNFNAISVFEPLTKNEKLWSKTRKAKFSYPFFFGENGSELVLENFLQSTFQGRETTSRTLQFNSKKIC